MILCATARKMPEKDVPWPPALYQLTLHKADLWAWLSSPKYNARQCVSGHKMDFRGGIKEDTKCGLGEQRWYFGGKGTWVGLHKMGELRNSKRRGNDIWGGAKSWAQRPRCVNARGVRGFEKSKQCGISLWNGAKVNSLACPSSPQRWELY